MKLNTAIQTAWAFQELIMAHCDHTEIVGSVRRRKPEVNDIEIVVVPTASIDLFGNRIKNDGEIVSVLFSILAQAISSGKLGNFDFSLDPELKRNGGKYKRFLFDGTPLDLFIAEPENLGNTLAIRTGNAEFSRLLVTPRNKGGLMPSNLQQKDGYLWDGSNQIVCRTEQDFFNALGIPFVEPRERNEQAASEIKRGLK